MYERGSGSVTFWVGMVRAVKLGWVGTDGTFVGRFTPDLLFSPFLFLFTLSGAHGCFVLFFFLSYSPTGVLGVGAV